MHTGVQCVWCVPSEGCAHRGAGYCVCPQGMCTQGYNVYFVCPQGCVHTGMQGNVCDLRGCVVCTGCALGSMCTQRNAVLCWPQRAVHAGVYETVCTLRGCGQGCRVWKRRHSSSRILLRRGNEEVSFL